jgi:hypothetical protein
VLDNHHTHDHDDISPWLAKHQRVPLNFLAAGLCLIAAGRNAGLASRAGPAASRGAPRRYDMASGLGTVTGSLDLTNNHHGVQAIGNRVGGAVINSGNSGAGLFPDDLGPVVSGNGPR